MRLNEFESWLFSKPTCWKLVVSNDESTLDISSSRGRAERRSHRIMRLVLSLAMLGILNYYSTAVPV